MSRFSGLVEGPALKDSPKITPSQLVSEELQNEVARAAKAYQTSPQGEKLLRGMSQMSHAELEAAFGQIAKDPIFSKTFDLARSHSAKDIGGGDIVDALAGQIGSVTFSAGISFGMIGGVNFNYGMGVNVDDPDEYSLFVSAGADALAGEEIEVSFSVGLAGKTPDGLDGVSVGVGVSATAVVGFAASASVGINVSLLDFTPGLFEADLSAWAISVGMTEGEGISASVFANVCIIIKSTTFPPMQQPPAAHRLRLYKIHCIEGDDNADTKDEIFIEFKIDGKGDTYRYPLWGHFSIQQDQDDDDEDGSYWYCRRAIHLDDYVDVTLWQGKNKLHTFNVKYADVAAYDGDYKLYSWDNQKDDSGWNINQIYYELYVQG